MKKRVMCVHTELVREGSVLYEGKDGNTGITTTEEAAGFAASFFGKQDKELLYEWGTGAYINGTGCKRQ